MRVFVNSKEVELLPGMTVRHALIGAGFQKTLLDKIRVNDEWGNAIGMDGAVNEGARIIAGSVDEVICPED